MEYDVKVVFFSKLKEKYAVMNQPVKAGVWFTASNILLRGISFITVPIFTRLLTTEDYGIVTLYQSWVTIIGILISLNVWTGGFNIGLTKHSDRTNDFVSAAQGLGVVFCLLFVFLTIVFIDQTSFLFGLSRIQTIFVVLQVLFSIPINIWMQKKRFNYSYKSVVLVSTIMSIINPLLGYILVISMEEKSLARIISFVILEIFLGTACFLKNKNGCNAFYNKDLWSFLFRFNIVLLPHYISTQILNQSDRVMIAKMCSNSEAGIYGVAYNFSMLMTLVTSGIESVVTPFTFKAMKTGAVKEIKKMMMIALSFIGFSAVVAMCVIPDLFSFLLPDAYYEAIYVIPVVVTAAFFQFLYPLFSNIELYYDKKKYVAIASCIGAVSNVGLNYIFIGIYGYIAAAYTTLFCYILFCVFHYYYMIYVLNENNAVYVYDIKFILLISLLMLTAMFAIIEIYTNSLIRYFVVLCIVVIFILFREKIGFLTNKRI